MSKIIIELTIDELDMISAGLKESISKFQDILSHVSDTSLNIKMRKHIGAIDDLETKVYEVKNRIISTDEES